MDTMWGKSVAIDLHGCDHTKVSSKEVLASYIKDIIEQIQMVAHGPTYIDRFGSGDLEGYSAMQFIETSSITVHCDEVGNRCFIDIFSCKDFDDQAAAAFSREYFGASELKTTTLIR